MKPQDEKLIWRYIDGECEPKERKVLQERIAQEPSFQQEVQARTSLHQSLRQMEAEQPSMRFVMNVMDRLPQLYKKVVVQPLIKPIWIRLFFYTLSAFALLYTGGSIYYLQQAESAGGAHIPVLQSFFDTIAALPQQVWTLIVMLCVSYLFFVWLDGRLNKRFGKKT